MNIFVSSEGNDAYTGRQPACDPSSTNGPVQTLTRARDLARQANTAGQPVRVQLMEGYHRLTEPLVLSAPDSGTSESPITWCNRKGETAVISGGIPVTDWEKPDDLPETFPYAARGKIWTALLPENALDHPRSLFDSHGLLPRACTEDIQAENREEVTDDKTLCFTPGSLPAAVRGDTELFVKPRHPWITNILPVAHADNETGILRTSINATYDLTPGGGWSLPPRSCSLENVPEGLTQPGRWMIDTEERRLYLWPRATEDEPPADVVVPACRELVRFEGDGTEPEWTHHIVFNGIRFCHADRYAWPPHRIAVQHDWEMFEGPTALVRLRAAENITIRNCRFTVSGGGGIRSEQHGVDNVIENNFFSKLGGSGIALIGYPPGDLHENHHNDVQSNEVCDIGNLLWHSSGILLCQSGQNRIRNNLLYHLPYSGVTLVSGREGIYGNKKMPAETPGKDGQGGVVRWADIGACPANAINRIGFLYCRYNVIEHNDVHHCMERLGDGNGIYVSGTGVANIVRRNWIHDIAGHGCQSAMRFDDMQWHCRMEENVVARINGGGITVKDVNDVENNIVLNCERFGCILIRRKESFGSNVRRNILVQSGEPFPENGNGRQPPFYDGGGLGGQLEEPVIDDNLLWCTHEEDAAQPCLEAMQEIGQDNRTRIGDPLFVDTENDDYRIPAQSPALRVGFRAFYSWGLIDHVGPVRQ